MDEWKINIQKSIFFYTKSKQLENTINKTLFPIVSENINYL